MPQTDSFALCADKTGAERGHVENDHDESKEIHSHRKRNAGMHRTNADQPDFSCFAIPNRKRISDFPETNEYSSDWEQILPSHEYLGINDVEGRTDDSAPDIRTIPPSAAQTFRKAAKKINDAQVKLKDPAPETEKVWISRSRFAQSPVERISIRQRG